MLTFINSVIQAAGATASRCAQTYYLEHRHKLSLFGAVPAERVSEHCTDVASDQEDRPEREANARPFRTLVKHRSVQKLLDVDRYRER